jgi:intergrase/recombinase
MKCRYARTFLLFAHMTFSRCKLHKQSFLLAILRNCIFYNFFDISKANRVSYNAVDKKLDRAGLPMRIKRLRSVYATKMRENGLLSEQIDLVQGRVGRSIFLQHYFKQDSKVLSNRILKLTARLNESFFS